ncbi:hypothetical protein FQN54_008370 [Arachnomyces sp. PD_36]|nr:hypothetical protein FQN54_008370 [Arachnomyces sp. PD_36]
MPSFSQALVLGVTLLSTVVTAAPVDIPIQSDLILKWALDGTAITNCDISNAEVPLHKTYPQLPHPPRGDQLKHVVIGRGTQNYTCAAANDASAVPESAGAVATLYDVSCLAANSPDLLHQISEQAEKIDSNALSSLAKLVKDVAGINLIEGYHYFDKTSTPFFDLKQDGSKDWISTSGIEKVPSPIGSVDWLRLSRKDSVGIKEVYRVETHGGQPPSTCAKSPTSFEVEYSAEYWFFG